MTTKNFVCARHIMQTEQNVLNYKPKCIKFNNRFVSKLTKDMTKDMKDTNQNASLNYWVGPSKMSFFPCDCLSGDKHFPLY